MQTKDKKAMEACGVGHDRQDVGRWLDRNLLAEHYYKEREIDSEGLNARQVFSRMRGPMPTDELTPPRPCSYEAPKEINAYSDGSLWYGRNGDWAMTAAAVWWPKRKLEDEVSASEDELAIRSSQSGASPHVWQASEDHPQEPNLRRGSLP